jgi:hypothetical protein
MPIRNGAGEGVAVASGVVAPALSGSGGAPEAITSRRSRSTCVATAAPMASIRSRASMASDDGMSPRWRSTIVSRGSWCTAPSTGTSV